MTVAIAKSAIDLGIVMRDAGAMTRFYGETLGLPKEGEIEMPGGVVMHRYQCGETVIKLWPQRQLLRPQIRQAVWVAARVSDI